MISQDDDKPFPVKLSDEAFETYELDPPPYTLNTTKKELKQMYYDMVSVRYVSLAKAGITAYLALLDEWKWPRTDYTKRRRSAASVISQLGKKPWLAALSTPSHEKTLSSQHTDVMALHSCEAGP